MDYYWVRNSKGEPERIPADKINEWDPDGKAVASEEEMRQIREELDRLVEETKRKLKMKE